ncbi:heat-shock protein [Flavobacterium cyanobacteriorum]|uniref:Heat-shock protein n=1 Tax=Flavobacterium cyanobacteriorum TaxID=2022802 RepID=A0A256A134_9FLAO|nr:TetR family transcriptional regulator C-terminal domain-containing protein [Flavobacterium cyanobacteriorum]OYQ47468.1 heat-shock protein [Flavobacterium cyanobacteriorum]
MSPKKVIPPAKERILSLYTDYCLMNGKRPATVYKFAKENGFEEADFYKHFSSFETLENHYFTEMFSHTVVTLNQSPSYHEYDGVQKLSAFYFTFFEMATANRSFISWLLKDNGNGIKNLARLKGLRKEFLAYASAVLEKPFELKEKRLEKAQEKGLTEGAWLQFLSVFKFWLDDTSAGFEKTDIFIEKSVKASADLVYNSPLQSLFDLGKFLWKERFTA